MDAPRNPRRTAGSPRDRIEPGRRVDEMRETAQDGAESAGGIVSAIIEDLQEIVRGEVQLAKAELKQDATQMGKGAGMAGGGAYLAAVGFFFLMLAVTYILNQWMQMWIAAGIVGIGLLVIGAIIAMAGKNEIQNANLKPQETIESLKEDQEWASRQMNSVKR